MALWLTILLTWLHHAWRNSTVWNSRWWFQPNFEKLVKIGIFPKGGWKRKNIWNHHLELYRPKSMPSLLAKHALRKACRNSCNSVDGNETFKVKKTSRKLEDNFRVFPSTYGWYQTLLAFYMVLPIVNIVLCYIFVQYPLRTNMSLKRVRFTTSPPSPVGSSDKRWPFLGSRPSSCSKWSAPIAV